MGYNNKASLQDAYGLQDAYVYKLMESAQKKWRKIKGFNLLRLVINNIPFKDGEIVKEQSDRKVA